MADARLIGTSEAVHIPSITLPTIMVVYQNPSDYPDKWVVRAFVGLTPEPQPRTVADSLEEARSVIPLHFTNIGRYAEDDPVIYESWI